MIYSNAVSMPDASFLPVLKCVIILHIHAKLQNNTPAAEAIIPLRLRLSFLLLPSPSPSVAHTQSCESPSPAPVSHLSHESRTCLSRERRCPEEGRHRTLHIYICIKPSNMYRKSVIDNMVRKYDSTSSYIYIYMKSHMRVIWCTVCMIHMVCITYMNACRGHQS